MSCVGHDVTVLGEERAPWNLKSCCSDPTLISVVCKASRGKQTEIHRNAPESQFRQQEGRAQQYIGLVKVPAAEQRRAGFHGRAT